VFRKMTLSLGLTILLAAAAGAESGLFVATTSADFGTGSIAYLPADASAAQVNLLNVHSDAGVDYYDGMVYIVNRLGQDNILVLDPTDPSNPVAQFSVGNGTNPQEIEFISAEKAYVSLNETDYVLIVNPQDGSELGRIDLSGFADADGLPEPAQMALVGDRLFVGIQRLDRDNYWNPAGESYLAVIDTQTDELIDADPATDGVQGIELASTNPGDILVLGDQLVIAEVGGYVELEGGIEVIDANSFVSQGLVVTEAALGGQIGEIAMVSATRGYATASAWPTYDILPFDLSSGEVGEKLSGNSGGYIPEMAADGDRLIVADRGTAEDLDAAGLLIFDVASGALVAGPISTGLPPNSVAVMSDAPAITAVLGENAIIPKRFELGKAFPNPFNAGTQIPFAVEGGQERVSLVVYDMLGRRIRSLVDGFLPTGSHAVIWDGLDDAGVTVGNGAYLVELRTGALHTTGKLMLLK
jgi:hypothetical protein